MKEDSANSRKSPLRIPIHNGIKSFNAHKNIAKFYYKKYKSRLFCRIFHYILLILLIKDLSNKNLQINLNFQYSSITLKIKGSGMQYVYDKEYCTTPPPDPDEIYINGINTNNIRKFYNFDEEENEVELIWKYDVNSTSHMFYGCTSITEINLTNFNSSKVTDMESMFSCCSSLTSIDFTNFDTSQVTDIGYMFYECSSLTSIDLSNFNTSQVLVMSDLFYGCTSLTSLDLSIFDTSKVDLVFAMFQGCTSLISLNLSNFDTSQ